MAFTKLTKDMAIIGKLPDEPNDIGGLTAQQLKEKFDEAGVSIKAYLNDSLILEIERDLATKAELSAIIAGISPDLTETERILSEM